MKIKSKVLYIAQIATFSLGMGLSTAYACTFAWNAPVTNTDGTPLTNLAGYRIYLNNVQQGIDIAAPASEATITGACQVGSYTITAFNTVGVESAPSSPFVVAKPNAPSNLTVTK